MTTDTAISEMNRLLDLSARQSAEIESLRAELAEARKDAERLDIAGLEFIERTLNVIAKKHLLVEDHLEPVRTINDAAKLAKAASARLRRVIDTAIAKEKS